MIKLTPTELQSILNAAFFEIVRHPESYTITKPKAEEIYRWLFTKDWDNPEEEAIMIDELPF